MELRGETLKRALSIVLGALIGWLVIGTIAAIAMSPILVMLGVSRDMEFYIVGATLFACLVRGAVVGNNRAERSSTAGQRKKRERKTSVAPKVTRARPVSTPADSPLAPTGWYTDPAGTFHSRFWNGSDWSALVRRTAGGDSLIDPASYDATDQEPRKISTEEFTASHDDEEWEDLIKTAGGIVLGGWSDISGNGPIQGTWVLGEWPTTRTLVLVFGARNPYAAVPYAQIEQADIRSVRRLRGGPNLAVEIETEHGEYCFVSPRGRAKRIMKKLGYRI